MECRKTVIWKTKKSSGAATVLNNTWHDLSSDDEQGRGQKGGTGCRLCPRTDGSFPRNKRMSLCSAFGERATTQGHPQQASERRGCVLQEHQTVTVEGGITIVFPEQGGRNSGTSGVGELALPQAQSG